MNITFFLLAAYVWSITACYLPLNDARFANRTLYEESKAGNLATQDKAWSTIIGPDNPIKPWPLTGKKHCQLVTIRYCYNTKQDRDFLHDYVEAAWGMWRVAIGDPNPGTAHTLSGFHENTGKLFCIDNSENWNKNLPSTTLVIKSLDSSSESSSSTVGYISAKNSNDNGRHLMNIVHDKDQPFDWHKIDIAHEMGHVLGLVHEHQRSDRDDYVSFDCTKIRGYDGVKKQYDQNPHDYPPMEEICASNSLAEELFDWAGPAEFSTDMGDSYGAPNSQTNGVPYDKKSIMVYPSWAWAEVDGGVKDVPLVYWKNGGHDKRPPWGTKPSDENAELVAEPKEITIHDAEFVRKFYPWK